MPLSKASIKISKLFFFLEIFSFDKTTCQAKTSSLWAIMGAWDVVIHCDYLWHNLNRVRSWYIIFHRAVPVFSRMGYWQFRDRASVLVFFSN